MNKILFCGIIWISGKLLLLNSHNSGKLNNIIWTGQQLILLMG